MKINKKISQWYPRKKKNDQSTVNVDIPDGEDGLIREIMDKDNTEKSQLINKNRNLELELELEKIKNKDINEHGVIMVCRISFKNNFFKKK